VLPVIVGLVLAVSVPGAPTSAAGNPVASAGPVASAPAKSAKLRVGQVKQTVTALRDVRIHLATAVTQLGQLRAQAAPLAGNNYGDSVLARLDAAQRVMRSVVADADTEVDRMAAVRAKLQAGRDRRAFGLWETARTEAWALGDAYYGNKTEVADAVRTAEYEMISHGIQEKVALAQQLNASFDAVLNALNDSSAAIANTVKTH
jgi:hypothetical protein